MRIFPVLWIVLWTLGLQHVIADPRSTSHTIKRDTDSLQDIVTWDDKSIFVHGEHVIILSGEFHPFRLPSPDLWLDVFQKIRALGYSAVSFYVNWALLEGERGQIRTHGVFQLDKFFAAAKEAGLYLIARPGPYINSEVSGGGFPGWLQRVNGRLKTTDPEYLAAITPYIAKIGEIVARAQITNGGPVILLQPENEYTLCLNETGYVQMNNVSFTNFDTSCLEKEYMQYVEDQYRKAGIVVPFIVNDADPLGDWAPGTGVGAVDIYSFDFYPLGWSTAPTDPSDWSALVNPLLSYNYSIHEEQSPTTPFSISEFQGGAPDSWGGVGVDTSAAYIGAEFARVFYKLNYGYRAAFQSLHMIFGGTNWGNLGHPGGYTSYDVGAAIKEDRQVIREKYSEMKLQAGFLQASPVYLLSQPDNGSYGVYTDSRTVATTRLSTNSTSFFIVRHGDLQAQNDVPYKLKFPTSKGNVTIPQLGGSLSLNGRDSKIHVMDYDVEETVRFLLECGANPLVRDENGRTAASWAASNGNENILRLLLRSTGDVERPDNDNRTLLSWAAGARQTATIELLLSQEANLESKDRSGRTPLSHAVSQVNLDEDTQAINILLEYGANLKSMDLCGRTPLSWAAQSPNTTPAKILIRAGADLRTKDISGFMPFFGPLNLSETESRESPQKVAWERFLRLSRQFEDCLSMCISSGEPGSNAGVVRLRQAAKARKVIGTAHRPIWA